MKVWSIKALCGRTMCSTWLPWTCREHYLVRVIVSERQKEECFLTYHTTRKSPRVTSVSQLDTLTCFWPPWKETCHKISQGHLCFEDIHILLKTCQGWHRWNQGWGNLQGKHTQERDDPWGSHKRSEFESPKVPVPLLVSLWKVWEEQDGFGN